jgi:hypothetical protein
MKDAGTSDPAGPTATILMDHFLIGKPSPAGGTSGSICYNKPMYTLFIDEIITCCVTSFIVRSIYSVLVKL